MKELRNCLDKEMFGNRNKEQTNSDIKLDIDYQKLATEIVKAQVVAGKTNDQEKADEAKKKRNELLKRYGYKEERPISRIFANIKILMKAKRSDITDDNMTFAIMKSVVETILLTGELLLYLFGAAIVYSAFNYFRIGKNVFIASILYTLALLVSILLARALRISRFEIDNMQDREYFTAIAGSFMAIIGVVVAIIALFNR